MFLARWLQENVLSIGREMRLSYLPPLMIYVAAGIAALTSIVGTFFVKNYLGLTAEFIASLLFWAGLPWALKMPLGHLVDLMWRWKSILVFIGAALITTSLLIMIGLLSSPDQMAAYASHTHWYVLATLLAPIGYVTQDVVADAMTVEAVPNVDANGVSYDESTIKRMHITMQTLGRFAIIGGILVVSLANVLLFSDAGGLAQSERLALYVDIYQLALIIPVVSVAGVVLGMVLLRRRRRQLLSKGFSRAEVSGMLDVQTERPPINWWVLGGGLAFAMISVGIGLADTPFLRQWGQEIIFVVSISIVLFLMFRLVQVLAPAARNTLVGTAFVIFVFRALPGPGAGASWWQIDVLGFDEQFLSILSLIASALTLFGLMIFRRFMADRSIFFIVGLLSVLGFILSLPITGMFYGLHHWTSGLTGGVVDARFIALMDTALESPLGQIAMVPMLAWIANSAPANLKATFFAVIASFTNLALSASQLGTKYLNQIYSVTREVKDRGTGEISTPADYSELGILLIVVSLLSLFVPLIAILIARAARLRSA